MDEYAGRLLAERYRLPLPPAEEYELRESRAYDTASGQEVLVRQVPLPEVVDAELVDEPTYGRGGMLGRAARTPESPAVRRAVDAATAASRIPDHPRLDQVFDVFVEDDGLWVVSELVAARPLAAVLAEHPLTPHRAAEIAADLLAALSAVHTYGWTHRNITARTVLICEDGRALLTGLASGAAEEALSGYDPLPTDGPMAPSAFGGEESPNGHEALPAGEFDAEPSERQPGRDRRPVQADQTDRGGLVDTGSWPGEPEEPEDTDDSDSAGAPQAHGPWGGDKPGPPMAIPVQLGYQPRRSPAARPLDDESGPEGPYPPEGRDEAYEPDETYLPEDREETYASYDDERYGTGDDGYSGSGQPYADEPLETAGESWSTGVSAATYRGPTTSLAADRARQARMTMIGPVTERWAPEQAGPVYENWRLAPPVGPAADLWALGALLFRSVQGHAPYPEESAAELVQLVCAEPPAFAEECGPLRPVIESLLRQDPTERPSFEELSGWLRSLVRSAPEPAAGRRVVSAQLPPAGRLSDPRKLPIIRRRGELVRRRRPTRPPREPVASERRRHRGQASSKRRGPVGGDPRRLGRLLVLGVCLLVAAGMAVAVWMMPGTDSGDPNQRGSVDGAPSGEAEPTDEASEEQRDPSGPPSGSSPQASGTPSAPDGYRIQDDPAGFQIAVPQGWARGQTSDGQVRFRKGGLELIVVPGRDDTEKFGTDPGDYQLSDQPELAAYRQSTGWKTSSGVRTITVGETAMAEGEFGWESDGRQTVLRNRVILIGGKYHVVLVKGPQGSREEIDEHFTAVVDTYRAGG